MKERLYTVEVMDALNAADECPCCYLERKIEQDTIAFVLGSSYMESDIREETDRAGFCRRHTKMMYDYGNPLGNAWILKTRLEHVRRQFHVQAQMSAHGETKGATGPSGRIGKLLGGLGTGSFHKSGKPRGLTGTGTQIGRPPGMRSPGPCRSWWGLIRPIRCSGRGRTDARRTWDRRVLSRRALIEGVLIGRA